jgi:sarcosine oxidase delta subunit
MSVGLFLERLTLHANARSSPMSEFLFLFRGSNMPARSPEQMQKSMQKWVAWFKHLNEKGVMKDRWQR